MELDSMKIDRYSLIEQSVEFGHPLLQPSLDLS